MHLRKNDLVEVVAGDDLGKRGRVLYIFPKDNRAIVEGANFIYRHLRRSREYPEGGRVQKEAPLDISNLKLVCPGCDKATKVGVKVVEREGRGMRLRICKKCGAEIEGRR
ncbi:MAG: 50S ribosomal protein L24 [Planctomycetes bacterium DG_23]|nr:MAG: 50S ribosomal protein L24 [Planctomycetes bacterium DG_23]